MMETMFEWGFAAWSTYAAAGPVIGYYAFNRGARFLPGEPIRIAFHNKPRANHAATLTNILAPPVAALTMAVSARRKSSTNNSTTLIIVCNMPQTTLIPHL